MSAKEINSCHLCMNSHKGKGVGFKVLYQTPDI